jgi:multidrug efflux pump subunit AcrA (membrane-fusion protein)
MSLFGRTARQGDAAQAQSADEQAVARYRYMLNTAPPETIEQAHAEAFAQLTPEQRRLVLQKLAENVPAAERASVEQSGANPQALARVATRAEIRQPGTMERMFGQAGGVSMGGLMAGTLLSSIAGTVLGSMIAREFFAGEGHGAGLGGATQPGEETGLTDADQAMDDGGGFDGGGFGDA